MEVSVQALDIKPTDRFKNHFNMPKVENNLTGTYKLTDKLLKIVSEFERKGYDVILDTYL